MAKDEAPQGRLEDLSDAEIERIEGAVFCCGGPPEALPRRLVSRACAGRVEAGRTTPR
jgi:hypothetical protein